MPKTPFIPQTFRLPPPLIGALEKVADREGVTFSEASRRVLQRGLETVPAQPPALAAGSRKDRAALLLAQMICICHGHFRKLRTHGVDLNKLEDPQWAKIEDLAKLAWIASGYLEELGRPLTGSPASFSSRVPP